MMNRVEEISDQYQNILLFCEELGISIDDVLEHNIQKANSRYDKDGNAMKCPENR